jgi:hypothetical protein
LTPTLFRQILARIERLAWARPDDRPALWREDMKSEVGSAVVSLKEDDGVSKLRSPASIAAPHPARRAFVDPSGSRKETGWETALKLLREVYA